MRSPGGRGTESSRANPTGLPPGRLTGLCPAQCAPGKPRREARPVDAFRTAWGVPGEPAPFRAGSDGTGQPSAGPRETNRQPVFHCTANHQHAASWEGPPRGRRPRLRAGVSKVIRRRFGLRSWGLGSLSGECGAQARTSSTPAERRPRALIENSCRPSRHQYHRSFICSMCRSSGAPKRTDAMSPGFPGTSSRWTGAAPSSRSVCRSSMPGPRGVARGVRTGAAKEEAVPSDAALVGVLVDALDGDGAGIALGNGDLAEDGVGTAEQRGLHRPVSFNDR